MAPHMGEGTEGESQNDKGSQQAPESIRLQIRVLMATGGLSASKASSSPCHAPVTRRSPRGAEEKVQRRARGVVAGWTALRSRSRPAPHPHAQAHHEHYQRRNRGRGLGRSLLQRMARRGRRTRTPHRIGRRPHHARSRTRPQNLLLTPSGSCGDAASWLAGMHEERHSAGRRRELMHVHAPFGPS